MDLQGLISRIDLRSAELGLNDSRIAALSGQGEPIRNWRRALAEGRDLNPRLDSLRKVAAVLNVPLTWLTDGTGYAEQAEPLAGFQESDTVLWKAPDGRDATDPSSIVALLAPGLKRPATLQLRTAQPGFLLMQGDVLVIEQAREARRGDVVVVNYDEHGDGHGVTLVRRYLPPYLVGGAAYEENRILTVDDSGRAAIIGTVVASFRRPST